jgi:hypothetical protein
MMMTVFLVIEEVHTQRRRETRVCAHRIQTDLWLLHNEGPTLRLAVYRLRVLMCWANAGMSLEVFPQCEALVAHLALEWPLPSMCASVSVQALLLRKLFVAHLTAVWFFPSMGP